MARSEEKEKRTANIDDERKSVNRDFRNGNDNDRTPSTKDEEPPEIRVTDRRRINLWDNGKAKMNESTEAPSLKPSYVEELETRTKTAERLVSEVQARFEQLRGDLQRETDQTRQRLNRSADERAQQKKAEFIAALLPVLDNLQRATEAAENVGSVDVILEGVRQTATSFENALSLAGVEPLISVGEPFNPELHEAVDIVAVDKEMDGKVVAEYARGYKMGDRLLRPARVRVGRNAQTASSVAE
jgi:molecular chaperone GrpE